MAKEDLLKKLYWEQPKNSRPRTTRTQTQLTKPKAASTGTARSTTVTRQTDTATFSNPTPTVTLPAIQKPSQTVNTPVNRRTVNTRQTDSAASIRQAADAPKPAATTQTTQTLPKPSQTVQTTLPAANRRTQNIRQTDTATSAVPPKILKPSQQTVTQPVTRRTTNVRQTDAATFANPTPVKSTQTAVQIETGPSQRDLESWAQASDDLITEIEDYYRSWKKDSGQTKNYQAQIAQLIEDAEYWEQQYSDDPQRSEAIESAVGLLSMVNDYTAQAQELYSNWDSEESYNEAVEEQKRYQAMLEYDAEAGQKEIEELEAVQEDMELLDQKIMMLAMGYGVDSEEVQQCQAELKALEAKYGTKEEIQERIQEIIIYGQTASRLQDLDRISSVADETSEYYDPEFARYSGYVSTNNEDVTYEYINNQNGYRDQLNAGWIGESYFQDRGYDHLTDDEIAIYNYYYNKFGRESAEHYQDLLADYRYERKAAEDFEKLQGNTGKEIAFAVEAGLDQFWSGVINAFNTEDDYIPVSADQRTARMVREDLADDDLYWYSLKDGTWKEMDIFGSSAGQMAFDFVDSTSHMLPSALTAAAVSMVSPTAGKVVGGILLGTSATGNAYQEMLNLGYNKGQARLYATLVGASEAGLSYLLSGISKLGGGADLTKTLLKDMDHSLGRVAIRLGGSAVSEFTEEYLQENVTAWLQNMVLNRNVAVNPISEDALYAGFMGMMTSTVFELVPVTYDEVRNKIVSNRTGIPVSKVAQILSGDMDAYAISQLFNENGIFLTDQNKADLAARLTEKGVASGNADTLANAVDAAIRGAELTDVQRSALEVNDVLAQAMADVFLKPWKKGATVNASAGVNSQSEGILMPEAQNGQNTLSDYVNRMPEVQTGRDVFLDYVNQTPEANSLQPTAGNDIPAMSRQTLANEAGDAPLQMQEMFSDRTLDQQSQLNEAGGAPLQIQEAFPDLAPDQQSALQTYQNAQIRLNELKQQRAQLQAELPNGDKAAMQAHASQLRSLNSQISRMEQSLRTAESSRTLQSLQPEINTIKNNRTNNQNKVDNTHKAGTINIDAVDSNTGVDVPVKRQKEVSYARPRGFRKGVREKVWRNAVEQSPDGIVRSPSGKIINETDNWQMGHKPGYEFRKHAQSAAKRGISRKTFLDEHNDPSHYRPELPADNVGHLFEASDEINYWEIENSK